MSKQAFRHPYFQFLVSKHDFLPEGWSASAEERWSQNMQAKIRSLVLRTSCMAANECRKSSQWRTRDTTWSEIGLWFRTLNMEQIAIHVPNDISWVPKNCRQNRRKANFRENTGSITILLDALSFSIFQGFYPKLSFASSISRLYTTLFLSDPIDLTVCPFICPFEVGLLVCWLVGLYASYNHAQWLKTLKNWTKIFFCPRSSGANEWAQQSARAKRAVRRKRMSERCERMSKRASKCVANYVPISRGSESLLRSNNKMTFLLWTDKTR